MKKSNVIVFVLLALASAFFLWLWYFLGLNRVDEPLDLVLSIVWWLVIVVAIAVIVKMERTRRQRVRTVYVGDCATFSRADFPDKDRFVVKYFVRTKQFEAEEKQGSDTVVDSEQASAGAAKPQIQQKTWTGEVFIVETKEERPFGSPEELARILASLEQAA